MAVPNNLPHQLTSFVGREREIDEVEELLDSTALLTLTGAGGCGKSRLGLQVAENTLGEYPGGVWLLELAGLRDSAAVPQAAAAVFGVREEPGKHLTPILAASLKGRRVLIILDNCEHLIAACAELAETLLSSCPDLHILATSRVPLGVPGEVAWRVPSLSTPEPRQRVSPATLSRYEAVQLFVQRARLRRPDFELTPENSATVALLCRRLDGIPLAIELAAARTRVLSAEQILDRLDERFKLLTSSSQRVVPRHQTLMASMDWSYNLLSEEERWLLRSLSVFAGSFPLEAVQTVCGRLEDQFELIELLSQLIDKSLVVAEEEEEETRYHMLETVRQYALEHLRAAGELDELGRRHCEWYLRLVAGAQDLFMSDQQGAWLRRLEREHDNLLAALGWCLHQGDAATGLQLAGAMIWFWYFRGYLSEGRTWLERMLALPGAGEPTFARALALSALGMIAFLQTDYGNGRSWLEGGIALWRKLGNRRGLAYSLTFLGQLANREGDPAGPSYGEESVKLFRETGDKWGLALALDHLGEVAASEENRGRWYALHEESLALFRELGHSWGIALELSNFGDAALHLGDYATARQRLEEALAIQRQVGDKWIIAWTLANLGDLARLQGDPAEAGEIYRQSLALFRELSDKGGTARVLHLLGRLALSSDDLEQASEMFMDSLSVFRSLGDRWAAAAQLNWLGLVAQRRRSYEEAREFYRESLALARELGDRDMMLVCLEELGGLAAAEGQTGLAARLLAATESLAGLTTTTNLPASRLQHLPDVADLRAEIRAGNGEQMAPEEWARGKRLSADEACALALGEAIPGADVREGVEQDEAAVFPDGLTFREVEVMRLIAGGLTDQEIADRLIISIRTVQAHIRSVHSKLGVTNRSAVTRYALERSLA